ncbi:MAG: hypothetical protein B7Z51_00190 [Methyloversatilis sp. 12-65-5]|nr:MAG: hypothetical protein B7Z51_00190 [Methyloversatilis sp. 12-65-5]
MTAPPANSRDLALLDRARQVIPNGMWGHMATRMIAPGYPQFFSRADGCRVWDVDGNEYIDFMCAWGPNVLGYHHPRVKAAAQAQLKKVDSGNGPTETLVELAELMTDTLDHADWCMFQKNGTDATTACVTIARAGTGRRKVLVAKGAYHGAVPWCSPVTCCRSSPFRSISIMCMSPAMAMPRRAERCAGSANRASRSPDAPCWFWTTSSMRASRWPRYAATCSTRARNAA